VTAERFAVPIPGGKLAGDVRGAGPAVVLLHGFTLDARLWDGVVDALAAAHTVVRLDLRGHGASSPAAAPYLACDDVAHVLDGLGLAHAALVGLSWGGQVALDAALAWPERVRALALVDSTLPGHDWSPAWRDMVARLRALALGSQGPRAAAAAWFAEPLFAPARARPGLAGALAQWETTRAGLLWAGHNAGLALAPAARARLRTLRVPTLVVVGERDLADFQAIAEELAVAIPHARKVVLPGVGHLPPLESPAELARVLTEFLAGAGA